MSSRLDRITDWSEIAREGGYRVAGMARAVGVSTRWLEIYFTSKFGQTPHALLVRWRCREILELTQAGLFGKAIAERVGLASHPSLSRTLKHDSGQTLTGWRKAVAERTSQNGNSQSSPTTGRFEKM